MQIQFLNNSTYKSTFGARRLEPQQSVLSRPALSNSVEDVVSFKAKGAAIPSFASIAAVGVDSDSAQRELSLEDFTAKMEDAYPNEDLSKVFKQIASDGKNFLGNGTVANVYSIPNVDDYVLRIAKVPQSCDPEIYSSDLKKSDDFSSKYNYGQPVAENYRGLFVLKKVTGAEHSFVNWNDIFHKMSTGSGMFKIEEVLAAIINKCKKAGEIAGLNRSQNEVRGVYSKISEKIQREGGCYYDFGGKYDKFAELYKDVL